MRSFSLEAERRQERSREGEVYFTGYSVVEIVTGPRRPEGSNACSPVFRGLYFSMLVRVRRCSAESLPSPMRRFGQLFTEGGLGIAQKGRKSAQ